MPETRTTAEALDIVRHVVEIKADVPSSAAAGLRSAGCIEGMSIKTSTDRLASDEVREWIESCVRELRVLRKLLRASRALERADAERKRREGRHYG
jgi:hypothetical protein